MSNKQTFEATIEQVPCRWLVAQNILNGIVNNQEHTRSLSFVIARDLGFPMQDTTESQRIKVAEIMLQKNVRWAVKYADALITELKKKGSK